MTIHHSASQERAAPAADRLPGATYRLQFHAGFRLADATALVPYLQSLGITDAYASPLFQPRPGSTHGYDVCNYNRLNPELGKDADFDSFSHALLDHGMGLLLDIVPNHMGIGHPANPWWWHVLQHGRLSPFAQFFDIDWNPPTPGMKDKVLVPVLGQPYGQALHQGRLQITFENGRFLAAYFEARFPLAPPAWLELWQHLEDHLPSDGSLSTPAKEEMRERLRAWNPASLADHVEFVERTLEQWHRDGPGFREAVDTVLSHFNGRPGQAPSFGPLHQLLEGQHYRLAFWKVGPEELNYRRFFDITHLAGLRVEVPEVAQAAHQLLLDWLARGQVTGLRIDHPDGLWDPTLYFSQLQQAFVARTEGGDAAWPVDSTDLDRITADYLEQSIHRRPPLYVVVEKILSHGESLPPSWRVHGTTGYDFLNEVNGLLVDGRNAPAMQKIYDEFIGQPLDYDTQWRSCKRAVLRHSLISEARALSRSLRVLASRHRTARDVTESQWHEALSAFMAALPVYRTYLSNTTWGRAEPMPSPEEETVVRHAIEQARKDCPPPLPPDAFDCLQALLLLRNTASFHGTPKSDLVRWVMKVQQTTGPVMAKGIEDTLFYRYYRLVSLNEVGGHPDHFGLAPEDFHRANARRHKHWPHTLLATATHDTKRGEDARARINVLSELSEEWAKAVTEWHRLGVGGKTEVDGVPAPSLNDEYLLYQTLLGVWPAEDPDPSEQAALRERLKGYAVKAAREAKLHTSWLDPNPAYEEAMTRWVEQLVPTGEESASAFLLRFLPFQRRVAFFGHLNSLSQTLLKATSPGVPDFYQGSELWDLSLVDPDNRRPVDFQVRQSRLEKLRVAVETEDQGLANLLRSLKENWPSGTIKLYLIWKTLGFRRDRPELFKRGDYRPVAVEGTKREHLCAYLRQQGRRVALVAVPRLVAGLMKGQAAFPLGPDVWGDTNLRLPDELAGISWTNILTGQTVTAPRREQPGMLPAGALLDCFPVALMEGTLPA